MALCVLGLGYVALAIHVYHLQIARHGELIEKARHKYTARRVKCGERGRICDLDGNLLAGSIACRDVLAEPRHFTRDRGQIIRVLSKELDLNPAELARRFAFADGDPSRPRELVVKRGVAIASAENIAAYHFRGIRFVDGYTRHYPKGPLLANLLGFMDFDGKGVSGIEQVADTYLRPTAGRAVYERDRRGQALQNEARSEEPPRNGSDVYLTIREPIQNIVDEELMEMVRKHQPAAAYAVMAHPGTGAVLAMAQFPAFDPNNRGTMRDPSHWRNRLLSDGFEPGSVMKAITVAGALDYGVVTLNSEFDCEHGAWVFCRRTLHDTHEYGRMPVWEIIQKSSNIGTAKIAIEMGPARLYQALRRFGIGEITGIGLPDEAPGIFRAVNKWDGLSISRFPIGQGVLVTPLHLLQAYCAIANRGVMMQLHVIDRIMDPETGYLEVTVPQVKRRAVKPEAAAAITQALKLVTITDGTGTKATVEGYEVAGKTGTAQKVINGQYSSREYVACFVGYVPADAPAFVLVVAADTPTTAGYYGGTVAAPVFGRMAARTLQYLQIAPAPRPAIRVQGRSTEAKADVATETVAHVP
jgi:cell division protein FtsI/penicillin-binding protein 2